MPKSPSTEPLVVKATDAATLLSCTRAHIYQLIERGALRRVHLPSSRAVRIPYADVLRAAGITDAERGDRVMRSPEVKPTAAEARRMKLDTNRAAPIAPDAATLAAAAHIASDWSEGGTR